MTNFKDNYISFANRQFFRLEEPFEKVRLENEVVEVIGDPLDDFALLYLIRDSKGNTKIAYKYALERIK